MEELNLSESEVEPVVDEMIEFVRLAKSNPKMFESPNFEAVRKVDADILWLKLQHSDILWFEQFLFVLFNVWIWKCQNKSNSSVRFLNNKRACKTYYLQQTILTRGGKYAVRQLLPKHYPTEDWTIWIQWL